MTDPETVPPTVAQLQDDLRQRDSRIAELKGELREAHDIIDRLLEKLEDSDAVLEQWIGAFRLTLDDDGKYAWPEDIEVRIKAYNDLLAEHNALVARWNKFVGEYNSAVAPRDRGRPMAASESQVQRVKKMKKAGDSLRTIAAKTGLGLRTVRTILEHEDGTGRTGKRTNEVRRREVDRLRMADWRQRKRAMDELPRRIGATKQATAEAIAEAKQSAGRRS